VSLISTETKEDGNTVYEIQGLMVEFFLLSIKKMNLTVVFLQPPVSVSFEAATPAAMEITDGITDVLVGTVPLLPLTVSGMTEPSIPYIYDAIKWFVPCPKPISRFEKILTVFDGSVWLTVIIVFVLTSALFWLSAN
jgi:hypothetical protein